MPMIGAAYLRCSDPRQDKSIDQQRDEITRRALGDAGGTAPSAPLDRAAEELRTEGLL